MIKREFRLFVEQPSYLFSAALHDSSLQSQFVHEILLRSLLILYFRLKISIWAFNKFFFKQLGINYYPVCYTLNKPKKNTSSTSNY